MWERKSPPDEQHRIRLETNCVLVRTPDSLGLIDTGYGGKAPPKFRQRHALEDGDAARAKPRRRRRRAGRDRLGDPDASAFRPRRRRHATATMTAACARRFREPGISFSEPNGTMPSSNFRNWPARTIPTTSRRSKRLACLSLLTATRRLLPASPRNSPADTRAAIRSSALNQPVNRPSASPTSVRRPLTCRRSGRWRTTSFRSTFGARSRSFSTTSRTIIASHCFLTIPIWLLRD